MAVTAVMSSILTTTRPKLVLIVARVTTVPQPLLTSFTGQAGDLAEHNKDRSAFGVMVRSTIPARKENCYQIFHPRPSVLNTLMVCLTSTRPDLVDIPAPY